ncbi:hypothetical protein JNUCC0626_48490 [Lentzea sp. JNUCC 0626]|uniref:hypothetical protein n=1 Tax=Lentzea sp. JNUCC 0626 TaxID=3367513 RepID=UPI0037486747
MLAEARGFRLGQILAHQHLPQLTRELREGLSTNARSKIYFNVSPDDARDVSRHTAPRLSEHDLAHLGRYHAAVRLVVDGEETPAFTLQTSPLPPAVPGRAKEIRSIARRTNEARAAETAEKPPSTRPRNLDPRRSA